MGGRREEKKRGVGIELEGVGGEVRGQGETVKSRVMESL